MESARYDDGSSRDESHTRRSNTPDSRRVGHSKHKNHHRRKHSPSDSSESFLSRRRSKSSKHCRKKDNRKSKRSKKHKKTRRERSRPASPPSHNEPNVQVADPLGAHDIAAALTALFTSYPLMSSLIEGGLPLMLMQLSKGSQFNFDSMPDRRLADMLEDVFRSLRVHGMRFDRTKGWSWLPEKNRDRDERSILRLVRALLNTVGVSVDAFGEYEQRVLQQQQPRHAMHTKHQQQKDQLKSEQMKNECVPKIHEIQSDSADIAHQKRIERLSSQLLSRFDPQNSSSQSTLAVELQSITHLLLAGEIIQLDGLENDKLKASLGQLFSLVGLELVEMEDSNESGETDHGHTTKVDVTEEETKSYGYALPEAKHSKIASNLNVVLRVCQFKSSNGAECAPIAWSAKQQQEQDDSSSEEDEGPAPIGTMAAAKTAKRSNRQTLAAAAVTAKTDDSGREEWMMTPGEHDFLKGIQSKALQSRTFRIERNRGQSTAAPTEQINPEVLAEVNAIKQAYAESRGPSLLVAHRQSQQDAKSSGNGKKQWQWNREKNLEDGRRVDKNALHLVLGGAKTELANKFEGSLGR